MWWHKNADYYVGLDGHQIIEVKNWLGINIIFHIWWKWIYFQMDSNVNLQLGHRLYVKIARWALHVCHSSKVSIYFCPLLPEVVRCFYCRECLWPQHVLCFPTSGDWTLTALIALTVWLNFTVIKRKKYQHQLSNEKNPKK